MIVLYLYIMRAHGLLLLLLSIALHCNRRWHVLAAAGALTQQHVQLQYAACVHTLTLTLHYFP
jgi:hypothetical protein